MSTKATIAHGDTFHFYHEIFDEDGVYLQLTGAEFEARSNYVMVRIPIHIWETIRHLGGARLDLVDKTDEELRAWAEERVDEQRRRIEHARATNDVRQVTLAEMGLDGGLDTPRDQQVEEELEQYRQERQRQREIKQAIEELKPGICAS
jgi:hypothetical protein